MQIETRRSARAISLLRWLPAARPTMAWVRGGDGIVGWGEAARFVATGADRIARVHRWWRDIVSHATVEDEAGGFGSGLVAFASLGFGASDDAVVVVPKVLVGRRAGHGWVTSVGGAAPPPPAAVSAPRGLEQDGWQSSVLRHRAAVEAALARLRAGTLSKVVIATDRTVRAAAPFDERYLLTRLAERFPTCWVFAVDGLVGATPELLLRRRGRRVSSRVLAGTGWRTGPEDTHPEVADRLLNSVKERLEHDLAVRSVVDALAGSCSISPLAPQPFVLHLPNVSHLASAITAELLTPSISLLDLADRVHPSGAVSGTPSAVATELIATVEGMARGGYLGPVGWFDAAGDGELGVALRCAQINGRTARLFAGGGIVAASDPDLEAAEVTAKLAAFQSAL